MNAQEFAELILKTRESLRKLEAIVEDHDPSVERTNEDFAAVYKGLWDMYDQVPDVLDGVAFYQEQHKVLLEETEKLRQENKRLVAECVRLTLLAGLPIKILP